VDYLAPNGSRFAKSRNWSRLLSLMSAPQANSGTRPKQSGGQEASECRAPVVRPSAAASPPDEGWASCFRHRSAGNPWLSRCSRIFHIRRDHGILGVRGRLTARQDGKQPSHLLDLLIFRVAAPDTFSNNHKLRVCRAACSKCWKLHRERKSSRYRYNQSGTKISFRRSRFGFLNSRMSS
jgi:hypothetical protein